MHEVKLIIMLHIGFFIIFCVEIFAEVCLVILVYECYTIICTFKVNNKIEIEMKDAVLLLLLLKEVRTYRRVHFLHVHLFM